MAKSKGKAKRLVPKDIDLDNPEFVKLRKLVDYTSQSIFLTGRAGTGKSTFLRYITATTNKKCVILAPTGIAAVNVGGQTIHSFFKLPFKPLLPDDPEFHPKVLQKRLKYSNNLIKLLKSIELIVIDEISMVRADIIDFIDKVLRHFCSHREPFGGKQMLFVGDIFQLEPVVTSDVRPMLREYYPEGVFFFKARAFQEASIVSIELRKVYRQTDREFLSLLDKLRMDLATEADLDLLNQRCLIADNQEDKKQGKKKKMVMTVATRRDIVDSINDEHLARLKTKAVNFNGHIEGDFPEASLPADKELILKEGAQVVMIKNDQNKRWVNGSIAQVVGINKENMTIDVILADSGETHTVEPVCWANVRFRYDEEKRTVVEEEIGWFTQFPMKLAWALTIHKCQGLTFSNVRIDLGEGAFSGGQTYVALSRCQSMDGLELITPIRPRDVFVSKLLTHFAQSFNDDRAIAKAMRQAQAIADLHKAYDNLKKGLIAEALELYVGARAVFDPLGNAAIVRLVKIKLGNISQIRHSLDDALAQLATNRMQLAQLSDEYVLLGMDSEDAGLYDAAYANYKKALSLNPDNARAAEFLAKVEDIIGA